MKRSMVVVALLTAVSTATAHEIKVFAGRLSVDNAGDKTTVYLSWGHRIPVDDLVFGKTITRYELIGPSKSAQRLDLNEISLQANVVLVKEPGINQAIVDRRVTVYTRVLDADGNKQLVRGPKSSVKEGKILQSLRSVQCGKALLIAGPLSAPAAQAPVPLTGQAIEIVPLENASQWQSGNALRFRVLLQGKSLPGATVTARQVGFGHGEEAAELKTDAQGMVQLRLARPGIWVLRANTKQPAAGDDLKAFDFTSYTATLTLEVHP